MRCALRSVVLAALVVTTAACGGDDSPAPVADPGGGTVPVGADPGSLPLDPGGTLPTFTEELVEVPEVQIRFANYMYDAGGAGLSLDLYWGYAAGSQGPTLEYGAVTDWMSLKVPSYQAADAEFSVALPLLASGTTDLYSPLQLVSQTLRPGDRMTFVLGHSRPLDGTPQYQYSFVFEAQAGPPPPGKALVILNEAPIGGIEGGDFTSLFTVGECNQWFIDNSVPNGNGGTGYVVDPGTLEVFASDANSDCSVATPPATIEATEGSVWLVIVHGTTREDRELTVLQVA